MKFPFEFSYKGRGLIGVRLTVVDHLSPAVLSEKHRSVIVYLHLESAIKKVSLY